MFTGIIERTAPVAALEDRPGRRVLTIEIREERPFPPWAPTELGESIAINGVCLTVVAARSAPGGERISFDAVPETLGRTTLGEVHVGSRVNLERSLRAGDRFGGHYVTGHVDGIGAVRARRPEGDQVLFQIDAPPGLLREMIPKGSVAVDGVSLTLIDVERGSGWFSFAVIPHTLEWTTLGSKDVRSPVNIETDAFGKWVLHAQRSAEEGSPSDADSRLKSLLDSAGYGPQPRHPHEG